MCYRRYFVRRIIGFVGIGRNGKSCFLKLCTKFLGEDNITSTSLEDLTNNTRFETYYLYRKLAAFIDETNYGVITNSRKLKQLTGGERTRFEIKGGKGFTDWTYAKLIMASNGYPISEDQSDAWWDRWLIIEFPNQFEEGPDPVDNIPNEEYEALARKVVEILPRLLQKRGSEIFTGEGTKEDRKDRYVDASNPLTRFLEEMIVMDVQGYIRYGELYTAYFHWSESQRKRVMTKPDFGRMLEREGIYIQRTSKRVGDDWVSDRWVIGCRFKVVNDAYDIVSCDYPPTHSLFTRIIDIEKHNKHKSHEIIKPLISSEFPCRADIQQAIQALYEETQEPYAIEKLLELFPGHDLNNIIKTLKKEGIIYEPRNGYIAPL